MCVCLHLFVQINNKQYKCTVCKQKNDLLPIARCKTLPLQLFQDHVHAFKKVLLTLNPYPQLLLLWFQPHLCKFTTK